jgi:hypothetical protein
MADQRLGYHLNKPCRVDKSVFHAKYLSIGLNRFREEAFLSYYYKHIWKTPGTGPTVTQGLLYEQYFFVEVHLIMVYFKYISTSPRSFKVLCLSGKAVANRAGTVLIPELYVEHSVYSRIGSCYTQNFLILLSLVQCSRIIRNYFVMLHA